MELKVCGLEKKYKDKVALNKISFSAFSNEILTIIGDSGSGKSTLLKALDFIEDTSFESITLDDVQLGKNKLNDRKNFGLVLQNYYLFPQYNALNNILMPLKSKIKKDIRSEKIPFFERNKEFKKRFDKEKEYVEKIIDQLNIRDILNSNPSNLSGGEAQRVSIVRSLSLKPKVLLLDEPTSALDPKLVNEISSLIKSLKSEDKLIIVVTHDIALAKKISDKVIFMKNGNIIERGDSNILFGPQSNELSEFLC